MKLHFLRIVLLLVATHAVAQDYTQRINYIFQYVDKNKVPTGLLSDYGLYMIEPDEFNGIPSEKNYVDLDTWKMLYSGMYSSRINTKANLTLPETVFQKITSTNPGTVPLSVMHFEYNKYDDNAVNKGLVRIQNDQIREVSGAASPCLTK